MVLHRAYAEPARPRVNMMGEEAAQLLGVTASGFFGVEWSGQRSFRWTSGAAELHIPIDVDAPPSELAIAVAMTGPGGKAFAIAVNGCTLFESTIKGQWAQTFSTQPVSPGLQYPPC